MAFPLTVRIENHDGKAATLLTEGGHRFRYPAEHLPTTCAPGDSFCLDLSTATEKVGEGDRAGLAMAVLNEILTAS
jgi:hypothetical protein